jgi:hypothetical protein
VFDQVYNKIPELLASIGKVKLKNIQRPVEVYRIILGQPVRSGPREVTKLGMGGNQAGTKSNIQAKLGVAINGILDRRLRR